MAPPITLSYDVVDTFPLYEPDGITKHSGITGFTVTIIDNGLASPVVGTVTEIASTGEYALSFTATRAGFWSYEVTNTYNDDVYGGTIVVPEDNVKFEMTASDNGVLASFGIWMTKDGVRVTDLDSMGLEAFRATGSSVQLFASETSCSTEGVFQFDCSSSLFSADTEYYLSITAARTSPFGSWSSNLGFTKV